MPKLHKKAGRPRTLGEGAFYITTKFRADQVKAINRIAGPAPGRGPEVIRQLLDLGIKVARTRVARAT